MMLYIIRIKNNNFIPCNPAAIKLLFYYPLNNLPVWLSNSLLKPFQGPSLMYFYP